MGQIYKTRYNNKTANTRKTKTRRTKLVKRGGNKQTVKAQDKKFVKLSCSPENKGKEYTCYTDEDLHNLSDMWNARHPDKKIVSKEPKQIWEQLKMYYSTVCNKESCWIS